MVSSPHPVPDLRTLRVTRGLIQAALGSRSEVIACEQGRKLPGPRLLARMAEALGLAGPVVFAACQESARRVAAGAEFGPSLADVTAGPLPVGETLTPARTGVVVPLGTVAEAGAGTPAGSRSALSGLHDSPGADDTDELAPGAVPWRAAEPSSVYRTGHSSSRSAARRLG